jgi:hypothetical protein
MVIHDRCGNKYDDGTSFFFSISNLRHVHLEWHGNENPKLSHKMQVWIPTTKASIDFRYSD